MRLKCLSIKFSFYVICVIQLLLTTEHQLFSFLGRLWLMIILNFIHILFIITGIFGSFRNFPLLLLIYLTWNLIWISWCVFLICFYLEIGDFNRNMPIVNLNTGTKSFWLSNGIGCKINSCLIPYYYVEIIHFGVQILASIIVIAIILPLRRYINQYEEEDDYDDKGYDLSGHGLHASNDFLVKTGNSALRGSSIGRRTVDSRGSRRSRSSGRRSVRSSRKRSSGRQRRTSQKHRYRNGSVSRQFRNSNHTASDYLHDYTGNLAYDPFTNSFKTIQTTTTGISSLSYNSHHNNHNISNFGTNDIQPNDSSFIEQPVSLTTLDEPVVHRRASSLGGSRRKRSKRKRGSGTQSGSLASGGSLRDRYFRSVENFGAGNIVNNSNSSNDTGKKLTAAEYRALARLQESSNHNNRQHFSGGTSEFSRQYPGAPTPSTSSKYDPYGTRQSQRSTLQTRPSFTSFTNQAFYGENSNNGSSDIDSSKPSTSPSKNPQKTTLPWVQIAPSEGARSSDTTSQDFSQHKHSTDDHMKINRPLSLSQPHPYTFTPDDNLRRSPSAEQMSSSAKQKNLHQNSLPYDPARHSLSTNITSSVPPYNLTSVHSPLAQTPEDNHSPLVSPLLMSRNNFSKLIGSGGNGSATNAVSNRHLLPKPVATPSSPLIDSTTTTNTPSGGSDSNMGGNSSLIATDSIVYHSATSGEVNRPQQVLLHKQPKGNVVQNRLSPSKSPAETLRERTFNSPPKKQHHLFPTTRDTGGFTTDVAPLSFPLSSASLVTNTNNTSFALPQTSFQPLQRPTLLYHPATAALMNNDNNIAQNEGVVKIETHSISPMKKSHFSTSSDIVNERKNNVDTSTGSGDNLRGSILDISTGFIKPAPRPESTSSQHKSISNSHHNNEGSVVKNDTVTVSTSSSVLFSHRQSDNFQLPQRTEPLSSVPPPFEHGLQYSSAGMKMSKYEQDSPVMFSSAEELGPPGLTVGISQLPNGYHRPVFIPQRFT